MIVRVRLYASLADRIAGAKAGKPLEIVLPANSTVRDLADNILPDVELKLTFVNGRSETLDSQLHENDEVGIFPAVGGG